MHFTYSGKNRENKPITGELDAENKESAKAMLAQDGIKIISIEVVEESFENKIKDFLRKHNIITSKPSLVDLVMFARQMYTLLRAGISIVRAIDVVENSVKHEGLSFALKDIVSKLEAGQNLAQSMHKHINVFPTLMEALVTVGENTGSLDEVFCQLAVHLEREHETKKRIKSAVRYPIMVILAITVAIGIINIMVIPSFAGFFNKFGSDLPLPTKILIASSDFTINYWYLILAGIFGAMTAWMAYIKTGPGHMLWDRMKIKLPLIGNIMERALLSRFARAFALTSRTGVPLLSAIEIIAQTTDNIYIGRKVLGMKVHIEHGESLAHAARASGMFSQLVLQMIAIGEETGDVDRLLDEVADFYDSELDYDLKTLSESIEPILISVVAILVLILALGVFLPMWDISKVALG